MNSTVYANSTSKLDMVLMIDTDVIWFNKQGNCSIILETWILSQRAFFDLPGGFMKEFLNGSILNMILIGWIVYYTCVLKEDVSQLRMVFLNKMNVNKTIEKGQQL
jgi:hypothetical protein